MTLKRVAIFQIRIGRFKSLFYRMSWSQSRFPLLRDMLQNAKPAVSPVRELRTGVRERS